jgi:hypothetical protein
MFVAMRPVASNLVPVAGGDVARLRRTRGSTTT